MKYSKVFSGQNIFLSAQIVTIETDIANGLHSFSIVGLGDKAVDEARDRVSAAIKNIGYVSPKQKNQKVVVSLAPADTKKEGSIFDLAIAIGYLIASGDLNIKQKRTLYIGELSLDGDLRKIHGVLPIVQKAKLSGFDEIIVPKQNAEEAAIIKDINIFGASNLNEVIEHISDRKQIEKQPPTDLLYNRPNISVDMDDIRGQESAKRGIEIAAAGGHNIALYGPPGTGKTMLAKALWGILPPLKPDECIEVTSIHSVVGMLLKNAITHPPFRSPHHTSSYASMVGGGAYPRPGEITLAHHGVLFLDEFPEFDKAVIESLRQPLEDRKILIARAKTAIEFPADCILLATMNPCPCGYLGSNQKDCTCTQIEVKNYQKKLSGPIIDRIDIWVEVSNIEYDKLALKTSSNKTQNIIERVLKARAAQEKRLLGTGKTKNAQMSVKDLEAIINISPDVEKILTSSAKNLGLSARAYHKTIRIAQTIADLEGREEIITTDILEALQYRPKNN